MLYLIVTKKILLALLIVVIIFLVKKTDIVLAPEKIFLESPIIKDVQKRLGFGDLLAKQETKIIIVGDIMLGRSVMSTSFSKKDFNYPFLLTADVLKAADITLGNLENPIIKDCPISNDGMIFCTDPKMISGLNFAGIDMVNLANNHTKNYGENGLKQTEDFLTKEKIDYTGVGNLIIKNIKEVKFGFLGFDFVVNKPKDTDYELIKNSKNQVDVLIVMIHWGVEYKNKANDGQKLIAKNMINNGADVIVGGHPHWVQDMEYIDGKPVFYSLGNFVFDQSWSEETKKGLVIRLNYQGKNLTGIDQMPIYMKNFSQPNWVE